MKITAKNLKEIYLKLDYYVLPKELQRDEYDIIVDTMLDNYDADDTIKEFVDLFCEKLTEYVEKSGVPQKTVEKETKEKAIKPAKAKVEKVVKPKKEKAVKPEKPKPKEIEKIPADVAFIKRYANFHKKTKTKKQVWDLLKAIQKAIAEKVLRKSDKYAEHIEHIQKQLTKCYRTMGNSIAVQLDEKAYEMYKTIANSLVVSDSVKMFKAFLRFHSNPDDQVAREILTKAISPKTELEKSVVNSLKSYISNKTINISDQELNGIYDAVGETKTEKKKYVVNAKSVVNSEDFVKMKFDTLQLTGDFGRLIGVPSANFVAMVYGSPGSGKTSFCLKLADYLCRNHNKQILFATIEQGLNHTFKETLQRMRAVHPNLNIAERLPENLEPYDVIILDSVNTFKFDSKKLRSLRETNPDKIFIWIFQTTKTGVFRGSQEYQHDCDVVIAVKNGTASTENQKNRFGTNGTFIVYASTSNIREKIEKFLSKFPKNATSWKDATDEIRDLSRRSKEYLEEYDQIIVEHIDFKKCKTPAQWNTKGRKHVLANIDRMSEQTKIAFYEFFDNWFE
jgi:DNA replication protein DnaC